MSNPGHGFHRWINPAGRAAPSSYQIEASEAERASLAAWLRIPAVRALHADLRLHRESADAVAAAGTFRADVDLVCGVTLETFSETLTGSIDATFSKDIGAPPVTAEEEVEINLDTEESRPWTAQGVDLGAMLAEELSLALPDFPRKPGAELPADKVATPEQERPNPFAVLAKLPRSQE